MTSWKGYAASFMPELMAEYLRRQVEIEAIDRDDPTKSRFVEYTALEQEMAKRVREHLMSREVSHV